jgi:plasmid stabilization system protein ParE
MTFPMSVPPERLSRVRWRGEGAYRTLDYSFSVRWNHDRLGKYVQRVLSSFAVASDPKERRNPSTPAVAPRYSLVKLGREDQWRYRLLHADEQLAASDGLGEVLEQLLWHVNAETFRTTGSFLLIHAGAVTTPAGDGLLLPGASGAGKSTLVAALVESGYGYLSDEVAPIDPVTGRVYPYPKALTLKRRASNPLAHLTSSNEPPLIRGQWHVSSEDIRPGALAGPAEVRYVILPRYEEGSEIEVLSITAAEAVSHLARSTLNLPVYGARALPLLARLCRGTRGYLLTSGRLDQAVRTIDELTSTAPDLAEVSDMAPSSARSASPQVT